MSDVQTGDRVQVRATSTPGRVKRRLPCGLCWVVYDDTRNPRWHLEEELERKG